MTKENLKSLRNKLGMSQTQFAVKLGLNSQTYISALESGKRPISRFVVMLCQQLEDELRAEKKSKKR